jgi:L-serine dehydratase
MRERERDLRPEQDVDELMRAVYEAMCHEVTDTIEHPRRSLGGLLDGQAAAVAAGTEALAGGMLGPTLSQATAYAMAVLERSANMGVIVAAPTAGSAGVIPGTVLAAASVAQMESERIWAGLWTAAAVGALVAQNASVSGAEGGCQAEVGTAAAMAAAALAEMHGASPKTCLDAAAIVIANMLGLVCDPVRGLVEYPCQLRNAAGVANAMSAAQLALSGIESPLPFDEVVEAMRQVGQALPASLRETALGGLAAAPSACSACCR